MKFIKEIKNICLKNAFKHLLQIHEGYSSVKIKLMK